MKCLFLVPVTLICLSSCGVSEAYRAMECNKYAIQRSTCAVEQNIQALDQVTQKLNEMEM